MLNNYSMRIFEPMKPIEEVESRVKETRQGERVDDDTAKIPGIYL